ncbi:DUF3626 domain-containing protein [Vibrio chagasii]|nr:DUF3626 domain-containing protein [Vibrio chagasii]
MTINLPSRSLLRLANKPLLEAIAEDGCLKSQFETGTSNGGMTTSCW